MRYLFLILLPFFSQAQISIDAKKISEYCNRNFKTKYYNKNALLNCIENEALFKVIKNSDYFHFNIDIDNLMKKKKEMY